ncbi:hypothetical protein FA15DRAFT_617035 [Coprinopsis marcescibilis]|uniref:Integral membrane protein n=1 Tax=Coprinopsis marcescibilis TaxID=230819 RepID=A0A5C3KYX9_COPMA|nr:hypothetical protein FA15DRAFT_617035 [Coprinopsis marcescibilis]
MATTGTDAGGGVVLGDNSNGESVPFILDARYQTHYLAGFWAETVLFGIYLAMFIVAIRIMTRKRSLDHFASRVFLSGIIMMFILIVIHNISVVYKMIRAYALYVNSPVGVPVVYFQDFSQWDNFIHAVIGGLLTWIGDVLVIYRCFLIWRRNYYVIAFPAFLLAVSVATTIVNWYWFQNPTSIPYSTMEPFMKVIFPVNLAQNLITTGLIAYKIYKQHRETRASGLVLASTVDLFTIARIVVESAAVYTFEVFIMIILFYMTHPGLVVIQHMIVPTMGIVFLLLAIRTHVAKNDAARTQYPTNSVFPSWMAGDSEDGRRPTMPIIATISQSVTEQHHLDTMTPTKIRTEHSQSYMSDQGQTLVNDTKGSPV